jgi:hypothetical protein
MIFTPSSTIFLADQRTLIESQHQRKYSTFRFDHMNNVETTSMYVFNDEMLAPNASNGFYTAERGFLIIIPITGTINYFDDHENETAVEVGEGIMLFLKRNTFVKLTNPYESEVISYLVIGIKHQKAEPSSPVFFNIDLSKKNQFTRLTPVSAPFKICMAQFTGRGENTYTLNRNQNFYAYVLAGAFEIEGRLLHDRDGLRLWNTYKVEIEALSNHATVITLELPS